MPKAALGRPSGPKSKLFGGALSLAVHELVSDKPIPEMNVTEQTKLRKIAEVLVENAMSGDNTAIKEVADRLDGKPHQTTDGSLHVTGDLANLMKEIDGETRSK